jgi:hypothetical protein
MEYNTDIPFIWNQWTIWKQRELFYEIKEEEYSEQEYSSREGMDSIYWCWNCKYSECDYH